MKVTQTAVQAARAMLKGATDVIGVSRILVWKKLPYFTRMLFRLKPVAKKGFDGIAVDGGMRLYYNPELIERWGVEYTPSFLAHELQHPMRLHPRRKAIMEHAGVRVRYERVAHILRKLKGIADWDVFVNWCGDLEINDDLHVQGWPFPPDWQPLYPWNHGLVKGRTMEEYANDLIAQAEAVAQQQPQEGEQDGPEPQRRPTDDTGGESEGGGDPEGEREGEADDPESEEDGGEEGGEDASSEEPGSDAADAPPVQDDAQDRPGDGDDPADDADQDGGSDEPEGDHSGDGGDVGGEPGTSGTDTGGVGRGGCGSGAGNPTPGEGVPEPGDVLPDPTTQEEVELVMRQVAQDVLDHAKDANARGLTPGSWLLKWAEQQFEKPKADPMKVLSRAVRGAVSDARQRVLRKMGPPSRRREVLRRMPEWGNRAPILPVLRGPKPRVMLIIDTSGSMGSGRGSRLEKAGREALGFARAAGGDTWGMSVDARVQVEPRRVTKKDDIAELMKGGGGTHLAVGVRYAAKQKVKPDVYVLITDGLYPGWPSREDLPPHAPVVTVVVNESREFVEQMPTYLRKDAVWVHE